MATIESGDFPAMDVPAFSRAEWMERAGEQALTAAMGTQILKLDQAGLTAMGAKEPEALVDLLKCVTAYREWLESALDTMGAVEARLMIVLSELAGKPMPGEPESTTRH